MTTEEIKQSVSMRELVERYGIHIDRKGFCCCPFHKEKTGSMKIYKDSYNCFGCGANGDIFSFVMRMENCDFKTAYKSLGGSYQQYENDYQRKRFAYQLAKRKETERRQKEKKQQLKAQVLEDIKYQQLFKKMAPVFSDIWCDAVNKLEYDFYLLEELTKEGVMIFETT